MKLYLQFGWGMMDHCRSLIEDWGEGAVILSPRDLNPEQLKRLAEEIRDVGGNVLVDPQFYNPVSDHDRLTSHDYWPKDYKTAEFWTGDDLQKLIGSLIRLNTELGCKDFILPGLYAAKIDDDWLEIQNAVFEEMSRQDISGFTAYATVALSSDAVRDNDQVHKLLDAATQWDVPGIYLICEHHKGEYLVNDATWVANVLDLAAGFHLKKKQVVMGYCNHQMLIAACTGIHAIASGTWMKLRSFPPSMHRGEYEEEIKQRAVWYYCPQVLSEYKLSFLDIAKRLGVLDNMKPAAGLASNYADALFAAPQPSAADFGESKAFRHYLHALRTQVNNAKQGSFQDTLIEQQKSLDSAERLLKELRAKSIRGQHRDFSEVIDVNRAALAVLSETRGAVLTRYWA